VGGDLQRCAFGVPILRTSERFRMRDAAVGRAGPNVGQEEIYFLSLDFFY